jgi:hypothetical protein
VHQPPFTGLTGNAASMAEVLTECECARLGKAGSIEFTRAKLWPSYAGLEDQPINSSCRCRRLTIGKAS